MLLASGRIIGQRYRLERPLARGGMGSVWAAEDTALEAPVAMKFIASSIVTEPIARVRFEREARLTFCLRSAHVVEVYDYGFDAGVPYLVMERLEGEDLACRLKREGSLSLPDAVALHDQVARALGLAHAAGIVHRDLKPKNIFFAREHHGETIKLIDFGLAKSRHAAACADGDHTRRGIVVGSPHHICPEQLAGAEIGPAGDLWALAVVLFRALTGEQPFRGSSLSDLFAAISASPPPPPSELVPELPATLEGFFDQALAKHPAERFSTAQAMAAAFRAIALGGVVAPDVCSSGEGPSLAFRAQFPGRGSLPFPPSRQARRGAPTLDPPELR